VSVFASIIDLGPKSGDGGGQFIAAGTPEDIARENRSYTVQFRAAAVARHKPRGRSGRWRRSEFFLVPPLLGGWWRRVARRSVRRWGGAGWGGVRAFPSGLLDPPNYAKDAR